MSTGSPRIRRHRATPEQRLRRAFDRNGCVRTPKLDRQEKEGSRSYKKGYELRLIADDLDECLEFARLLARLGIETGAAYEKRGAYVLPVYGRERVLEAIRRLKLRKRHAPSSNGA